MCDKPPVKNNPHVPREQNELIAIKVMASLTSTIDENKGWWYLSPTSCHKNNQQIEKLFPPIHKLFYLNKFASDAFFIEAKCIKQVGEKLQINSDSCENLKVLSKSTFDFTSIRVKDIGRIHLFKIGSTLLTPTKIMNENNKNSDLHAPPTKLVSRSTMKQFLHNAMNVIKNSHHFNQMMQL